MAPQNTSNRANKKVANGLVAMSSAAVLAVYAAGYARTRSAADRFALQASERRPDSGSVRLQPDRGSDAVRTQPDSQTAAAPSSPAPVHAAPPRNAATSSRKTDVPISAAAAPPPAETPAAVPEAPPLPPTLLTTDAQIPAQSAVAPVTLPKSEYRDGTYLGWGHCRHGDIQAQVVIADGRIASATIAQCLTRYSCSVIAKLPPEVAQRQSPDVDTISGATQSADAFYYAVIDALSLAK